MKQTKKRIAIVPGSFDPITRGHMDIIKRALEQFDEVYVAVLVNPAKQYMFSIEQRKRIVQAAVQGMERVSVLSSEGMLWRLAQELKASAIVKGYRNDIDWRYECEMAEYNRAQYPDAETILLKSKDSLAQVSSTVVRERILNREELAELLPEGAIQEIQRIMKEEGFEINGCPLKS